MTFDEFAANEGITEPKLFADGRVGFLYRLLFTCAVCVADLRDNPLITFYRDRWCYDSTAAARQALNAWDGGGEPQGWHRHPTTGRRRPDGDPAREFVEM